MFHCLKGSLKFSLFSVLWKFCLGEEEWFRMGCCRRVQTSLSRGQGLLYQRGSLKEGGGKWKEKPATEKWEENLYHFISMCLCVFYMTMCSCMRVMGSPGERIWSHAAGVVGSYEPPDVKAGNWPQGLMQEQQTLLMAKPLFCPSN